ncbi:BhlA/UviB family holin-like peptide [Clostridium pasteurianum]|uniref:Bacteriocin UviB n=1 Tax=Clostridium pasteurianum BC1 TaxID=86416 RepID=R4KAH8_CLOPA|nr:BhlA/UviB family holin-like peptide [Clostridium pasteurianum]AGK96645.1 Protein of unknown function (DUF2762) [Clostridium pasteurianum BC1]AGK99615.1 Protein of unknown function (DUF2762) [Clostridium pasteurianum BC1]
MESDVLKLAASQGIWALLSVILIYYILKAQEKRDLNQEIREKNYQNIILNLTKEFEAIEDVKKNIIIIREHIDKKNKD